MRIRQKAARALIRAAESLDPQEVPKGARNADSEVLSAIRAENRAIFERYMAAHPGDGGPA